MNGQGNEGQRWADAAIATWDNEGGATGREAVNRQYGRRVEPDRSWTVYHVFTGIPARRGGQPMVGLSRSDATAKMIDLNHRNTSRWKERMESVPNVSEPGRVNP